MPMNKLVALVVAVAAVTARQAVGLTCVLPTKTLTFQCDSKCSTNVPCWFNTTTSTTTNKCEFTCLPSVIATSQQYALFLLLVPFGTWKSAQQTAANPPLKALAKSDEAKYLSLSNNYLDAVDSIPLASTLTWVCVLCNVAFLVLECCARRAG